MILSDKRKCELFDKMLKWIFSATDSASSYGLALANVGMTRNETFNELWACCDLDTVKAIIAEIEDKYGYWSDNKMSLLEFIEFLDSEDWNGTNYIAFERTSYYEFPIYLSDLKRCYEDYLGAEYITTNDHEIAISYVKGE